MRRTSSKKSSKVSNKKVRYKFDTKSNVIMEDNNYKYILDSKSNVIFEDNSSINSKFKMIFDKDEPFYKHTFKKEQ